jgi:transposase
LHVLDRFHITSHLNQALDQVRRAESGRLRTASRAQAEHLKNMRWNLLRRTSRVRGRARCQLGRLLRTKLETARAWALKALFEHFWTYKSVRHAGDFLDYWTWRALRSRIKPMKKVAHMLRTHEELLLNWFRAKGEISSGVVEGLNNKIRVVTRRSYGFRTFDAMEIVLYHTLGKLPEPEEFTHSFLLTRQNNHPVAIHFSGPRRGALRSPPVSILGHDIAGPVAPRADDLASLRNFDCIVGDCIRRAVLPRPVVLVKIKGS